MNNDIQDVVSRIVRTSNIMLRSLKDFSEYSLKIEDLKETQVDMFYLVNESVGYTDADVTYIRAFFVDIDDDNEQNDKIKFLINHSSKNGFAPHFVLETSPHRFHVYWLVDKTLYDSKTWAPTISTLIDFYKSDKARKNPSSLLRVPLTINNKNNQNFKTNTYYNRIDSEYYNYNFFSGVVKAKCLQVEHSAFFEKVQRIAGGFEKAKNGERNQTLYKLAVMCGDYNLLPTETMELLEQYNNSLFEPVSSSELQKVYDHASKYRKSLTGVKTTEQTPTTTNKNKYPAEFLEIARRNLVTELWQGDEYTGAIEGNPHYYSEHSKHWESIDEIGIRTALSAELRQTDVSVKNSTIGNLTSIAVDEFRNRPKTVDTWDSDITSNPSINLANGILDLKTRELKEHSHRFFSICRLDYSYNPEATCPNWEEFLESIWEKDEEAKDSLQCWMGYLLTNSIEQQKIALLIGESRAGKGVISRVIDDLMGRPYIATTNLLSLGREFGLYGMHNKKLIQIRDVAKGKSPEVQASIDVLRAISGEDEVLINRKHLSSYYTKINAKIMMYANELPQFADSKSALSNRFLVLKFNKSFYGKEDLKLESRLANERAGILNWALTGLDRLQDDFRGKLPNCSSGLDELEEIKKSTDSVYHFYHEVCMKSVEIGGYTHAKDLYDAYRTFCIEEGRQAYSAIHFGRTITKLLNQLGVDTVRKQEGRYYKNLKVNDAKVDLFN